MKKTIIILITFGLFFSCKKPKNVQEKIIQENSLKKEIQEDEMNQEIKTKIILKKGDQAPNFIYKDLNEKEVSLESLKGNYVFIKVWASWCGACLYEIPYLKRLWESYKEKPIKFVSISIDTQKDKWKKKIEEEGLINTQIIQLITESGNQSEFLDAFGLQYTPHFILLDKEGKVMEVNAVRPSQEVETAKLFSSLD